MAVSITWKITMTDAEFTAINTRAVTSEENAGKYPNNSPLTNVKDQSRVLPYIGYLNREGIITATSATGTTTIVPAAGQTDDEVLDTVVRRVVRGAKEKGYTINYTAAS